MITDGVAELVTGPWALAVMSLLVLGDAFFVVVPGEIAVTALGALAISTGAPPLWAVIVCAAVAATAGDLICYSIGRWAGIDRWRWMRAERVQRAQRWARGRLESGTAVVLFTARFIPFARLAINLVAGATRIPLPRYGALVALAATGWAAYQAAIGALIAAVLPGGPIVAIVVSVICAVAIGALIDLVLRRRARRRISSPSGSASD
ncbi:DedA family protein [Microbacterium sp. GXF0217]